MIVFSSVTTYLVDAVPGRSASAVAVNNLFRMGFAAGGSMIARPVLEGCGNGVLFSAFCGVGVVSSGCFWAIGKVVLRGWS
jgi:hypothetical protein